jgi:hypothetical protein
MKGGNAKHFDAISRLARPHDSFISLPVPIPKALGNDKI